VRNKIIDFGLKIIIQIMSVLELRIYQEGQCILRYQPAPHNFPQFMQLAITNKSIRERIVVTISSTHHILIRQSDPFYFVCLATKDAKIGMLDSLLDDIKIRLVGMIEQKGKYLSKDDLEDLFDYIDRLINYYTNDTSRLIKFDDPKKDESLDYDLFEVNTKDIEGSLVRWDSPRKKTKSYRPSSSRKEISNGYYRLNEKPSKKKMILIILFLLMVLGFILSLYICGGYSFDNCR
jgi:hypothetical protein